VPKCARPEGSVSLLTPRFRDNLGYLRNQYGYPHSLVLTVPMIGSAMVTVAHTMSIQSDIRLDIIRSVMLDTGLPLNRLTWGNAGGGVGIYDSSNSVISIDQQYKSTTSPFASSS